MTKFSELGLAAPILMALTNEGYEAPTPIQAQTIPSAMAGRDVLGIAQTGTGKTAAFSLPILNHLATHKHRAKPKACRVLVLCPTRELASQIAQSMKTYGAHLHLHIVTVFGGVPYGAQIRALAKGVDVLVATPGRLVDHIDSHNVDLGETEVLVLDEVDQMLDLGFVKAIRRLVRLLPAHRQNLFFSATMPKEIGTLAGELLKDPVQVSVTPVATTAERVEQKVYFIEQRRKQDLLVELFADPGLARTIVFTRTKRGADKVAAHMEKAGISSAAIHGNKSQNQRERSLADFRQGKVRAMIATDIAARGIDIDSVSHVINFDLPEVAEAYVHRIGRTARAGAEGHAISLVDGEERGLLRNIEKLTRQQIEAEDRRDPHAVPSSPAIVQPDRRAGGKGGPAGRSGQGDRYANGGRGSGNGRGGDGSQRRNSEGSQRRDGEGRSERFSDAVARPVNFNDGAERREKRDDARSHGASRPSNGQNGHQSRSQEGGFTRDMAGASPRKRPGSASAQARPQGERAVAQQRQGQKSQQGGGRRQG